MVNQSIPMTPSKNLRATINIVLDCISGIDSALLLLKTPYSWETGLKMIQAGSN